MSQFDNTAMIISYAANKAGRADVRPAPLIECLGGDIIDEDGHPFSQARFGDNGEALHDAPSDGVCAALMSLHEALTDEAASPVFEQAPRGALHGLGIELIAARGRGETLIMMRVRHPPPLL